MQVGSARVSTNDRSYTVQVDALRQVGGERIYREASSGARAPRLVVEDLVAHLRAGDKEARLQVSGPKGILHPLPYPTPLIGLAAIASRTQRLRLGTGVLPLPVYHPLAVAEEGAMLDVISDGRRILGPGAGYAPEEFSAFGISIRERGSRLEEGASLLRQIALPCLFLKSLSSTGRGNLLGGRQHQDG